MRLLSTVEDSFQIEGRGCVICFRMPKTAAPVHRKDAIRLIKFDGSLLDTEVAEIEMIKRGLLEKTDANNIAFLLPKPLTKSDAPRGTEIWLLNE